MIKAIKRFLIILIYNILLINTNLKFLVYVCYYIHCKQRAYSGVIMENTVLVL